ncbi:hypothetical protein ACIGKR_23935 [Rhodococcus qingshengii]|uniref:hypothetical protein n=1 Tax=Rhodococcus qingshengii TaxID=334542 RepID=UPI0037CCAA02
MSSEKVVKSDDIIAGDELHITVDGESYWAKITFRSRSKQGTRVKVNLPNGNELEIAIPWDEKRLIRRR